MGTASKSNALLKRITNVSLLQSPLRIIEKLKNAIRSYNLRKKQAIIKQGAPECFEANSPLKVEWSLTSYCNYRCSYCFDVKGDYEKVFCSFDQAEKAIKHIASANRSSYQVSLQGGEPTSHPYFSSIVALLCKYLGNRLESLLIITNGSFNEEQLETVLSLMEQYSIKVYVSIHLEFMSIERVIYLVERLSKHGVLIMAVMFHPGFFEKAKTITDALCELRKSYPFDIEIKYLRTPPSFDGLDPRYTQEHFDWADAMEKQINEARVQGVQRNKDHQKVSGWEYIVERKTAESSEVVYCESSEELRKKTGLNFSGMLCCSGTNVLSIDSRGYAKGLVCSVTKQRCNIFEEDPFQLDGWMYGVTCTKSMCGCPSNHRVPKFKSTSDAKKHIAKVKEAQKKQLLDEH